MLDFLLSLCRKHESGNFIHQNLLLMQIVTLEHYITNDGEAPNERVNLVLGEPMIAKIQ